MLFVVLSKPNALQIATISCLLVMLFVVLSKQV